MLTGKTGKAELSGSASVFTVHYLGSCEVQYNPTSADGPTKTGFALDSPVRNLWQSWNKTDKVTQQRKAYIVVTVEGIKLHLRQLKGRIAKESEAASQSRNLITPLHRLPCCGIPESVDPRLFAWVEQVDTNEEETASSTSQSDEEQAQAVSMEADSPRKHAKQPEQLMSPIRSHPVYYKHHQKQEQQQQQPTQKLQAKFICHAAAFPRPELADEMLSLTGHFIAAVHRDQQFAKARQLRRSGQQGAAIATSGASSM